MFILDTDHISVLQRSSDGAMRLQRRLLLSYDFPVTTAITLEEQSPVGSRNQAGFRRTYRCG